jgi:hypothetical protein
MTPFQFQLVRLTWAQLQPRSQQVGALLQCHLGADRGQPQEGQRLMALLDVAIHRMARSAPMTLPAGLGSALMGTLDEALGVAFSPAVREAWEALCSELEAVEALAA